MSRLCCSTEITTPKNANLSVSDADEIYWTQDLLEAFVFERHWIFVRGFQFATPTLQIYKYVYPTNLGCVWC